MRKLFLIAIFLMLLIFFVSKVNAQTIDFNIILDKSNFLRYEIVSFKVNLTVDGNSITDSSVVLSARFYNSTGLVTSVGSLQIINLYYNYTDSLWYGYWSIPWNPNLGTYTINVTANVSGNIYYHSSQFNIVMRQPKIILPPGYLAMTVEQLESHISYSRLQLPGPFDNLTKNWTRAYEWARFMGVDSVWPTKGYIAGYSGCDQYAPVNQSFPWCSNSYHGYEQECAKVKENGFTCAAWIWPYSVAEPASAKTNFNFEFNWSWIFDCSTDTIVNSTGRISILDEKAIDHTIKMINLLNIDSIDTIGIDWEPAGYEDIRLANDDFIRKMNIDVPSSWSAYTEEEKMKWVGRRIRYGCSNYNTTILDRWHRWMAYNYALKLKKIIEDSGSTKSFFMYTWSSNVGRDYSHDPFIFNDAGIDIIAPMTYTAPAQAKRPFNPDWPNGCWFETAIVGSYKREVTFDKLPNLVMGQMVQDAAFINCSYQITREYPAPLEMYDRMMITGRGSYKDGNISGLFWHDIYRGLGVGYGTGPVPYSPMEYAVAGGAAASELRLESGRSQVNVSIDVSNEITYGNTINGNIIVKNLGSSCLNINVLLINNTPGWNFISAPNTNVYLCSGNTENIPFIVKSNLRNYNVDNRFMIAAKTSWGSASTDTHLEFKYVHVNPKVTLTGKLVNKENNALEADVILYQKGTNTEIARNRTDSYGNYYFYLNPGIYDVQFNFTNFFMLNYSLRLNSVNLYYDSSELINYVNYNSSEKNLTIAKDINGTQTFYINSLEKPRRIMKNNTLLTEVFSISNLSNNRWFYDPQQKKIYIIFDKFFNELAAQWKFDEGSGSTVYDSSGNGNNGTIYGASWSTSCHFGSCLRFDGSNDYILVPDSTTLNVDSEITIEAWVYPTGISNGNYPGIVAKYWLPGYLMGVNRPTTENNYGFWLRGQNNGNYIFSDSSVSYNQWVHLAVTRDSNNTMKMFVNGNRQVQTRTSTLDISSPGINLRIGTWDGYFNGFIDEIKIYNRALSEDEIKSHASS